ncbi:MAG: type III-B CRISPR module RAMP protein Cmr4 [bacterium]
MPNSDKAYVSHLYYAVALDPIHVGTGSYQLGRTDNPIVRDPATNVPKIPATSIHGASRSYTGLSFPKESCGGRGKKSEKYCGKPDCPICIPYGFPRGEREGFQGMAQFFDAHILLFPVHTMVGPAWIVSVSTARELVNSGALKPGDLKIRIAETGNQIQTSLKSGKLNLGWLMLEVADGSNPLAEGGRNTLAQEGIPPSVMERLILVPDKLFGQLVNSNIEVRTSVSIDPVTGASKEGALFNYEAIPRATILWFTVVYKNPRNFKLNGKTIDHDVDWVQEKVEKGLECIEYLGIGGMVTRGMGRMRTLNLKFGRKEEAK